MSSKHLSPPPRVASVRSAAHGRSGIMPGAPLMLSLAGGSMISMLLVVLVIAVDHLPTILMIAVMRSDLVGRSSEKIWRRRRRKRRRIGETLDYSFIFPFPPLISIHFRLQST